MNKNNVLIIGAVAVAFAAIGALVATLRGAPAPLTSTPVLAAGAGQSAGQALALGPVDALYAQSLNDAAGAPHALSQWRGKALVVNFWAPWCAPCVQEMPELAELATELATGSAAKNIHVIGIGIDSPSNIAQFASTLKITYPLYVAGMSGTELARNFGNSAGGLPYTVLIGSDGKVKKTYLGRLKFSELKADLAKL
ncbi:MAG: TlpA family protein disulfide reductase [Massilia sp.]|nr:TlpA family protein disulfide reductase [Massilia sp.]